jgi:hypothetical protein
MNNDKLEKKELYINNLNLVIMTTLYNQMLY